MLAPLLQIGTPLETQSRDTTPQEAPGAPSTQPQPDASSAQLPEAEEEERKTEHAVEQMSMSVAVVEEVSVPGVESAGEETTSKKPPPSLLQRLERSWYSSTSVPEEERWYATNRELVVLFCIGLVTGVTSVLTGTGGMLVFLPQLRAWKGSSINPKVVVGCAMVMSSFLAVAAIASTLANGLRPDGGLVLLVGGCAVAGVVCGAKVLEIASRETLQVWITAVLLVVAALVISEAIHTEE